MLKVHKFVIPILLAVLGSSCIGSTPTETPTLAPTSIATHTVSSIPRPTSTVTSPPEPGSVWNGDWQIYINGNEAEWDGMGTFSVSGNIISGEFAVYDPELGTLYYSIAGMLDADGVIASGQWVLMGGGSGPFELSLVIGAGYQFTGNLEEGKFQFCGWRRGASRPSPCEWP